MLSQEGTPDDTARAVRFPAAVGAHTGRLLVVDAGFTIWTCV